MPELPSRSGHPVLFLDVDGTLIPFGAASPAEEGDAPHLERLNKAVGARLAALPCELVWATTWEEDANTELSPRLGWARLPVVLWPEPEDDHLREDQWFGLHWKTRALTVWAAGRPFVWVDDEITESDREWVATNHRQPALLLRVEASRGVQEADLAILEEWLRQF